MIEVQQRFFWGRWPSLYIYVTEFSEILGRRSIVQMFSRIVGLVFEAFVRCSGTYRRRLVEKCRVELMVNAGCFYIWTELARGKPNSQVTAPNGPTCEGLINSSQEKSRILLELLPC